MKRTHCLITISVFAIALFALFILNIKNVISSINTTKGLSISERTAQIESNLTVNVKGKPLLTEVYGAAHNALNLHIIGAFEYVQDKSGIMQHMEPEIDYTIFINSMKALSEELRQTGTPLVIVQLPDRGSSFQFRDYLGYSGKGSTAMPAELVNLGLDVINIQELSDYKDSNVNDNYFLRTDCHLTTQAEFFNSKVITEHLSNKYSIQFPSTDIVYNAESWTWVPHVFCGNYSYSSGRIFAGIDIFYTFQPKFETSLRLTIPADNTVRNGSFSEVMTNGLDSTSDRNTYWVVNYGQWPKPAYTYENLNEPDGPRLLVLSDSVALRTSTFLTMNASSVTVLDPRYFNGEHILASYLSQNSYDAVIIITANSCFYYYDMTSCFQ